MPKIRSLMLSMLVAIGLLAWQPSRTLGAAMSVVAVLTHEDALNEAHDVQLCGNLAFVPGKGGSIAIIDVADPSLPKIVWFRRDTEGLHDSETVLVDGDRLFLGTDDFHSIDVSNPAAPKFDAAIVDRSKIHTINGMVRRGDYIFAACKSGLVTAIDVSNPVLPKVGGVLETPERFGLMYPHDVDLFGPFVVVVDPNNFGMRPGNVALIRVFDKEGHLLPDSKWELAGRASGGALNGANRVQVQGHYAFVAGSLYPKLSQGKPMAKGVVMDLSNPAAPRQVAVVNFPDLRGPNGLTLAGRVWFLSGGQTVQAYDISEPWHPRLLASFKSTEAFPTADDNAHDLVYRDGYLYVSGQGDHRFVILRVDDEEIRRLAAQEPSPDNAVPIRGVWHRNTFPGPGHVENAGPWGPYQGSDRCEFINYFLVSPVDPTFMAPGEPTIGMNSSSTVRKRSRRRHFQLHNPPARRFIRMTAIVSSSSAVDTAGGRLAIERQPSTSSGIGRKACGSGDIDSSRSIPCTDNTSTLPPATTACTGL